MEDNVECVGGSRARSQEQGSSPSEANSTPEKERPVPVEAVTALLLDPEPMMDVDQRLCQIAYDTEEVVSERNKLEESTEEPKSPKYPRSIRSVTSRLSDYA